VPLNVVAINCTLKRSPAPSSTEKLLREMLASLAEREAQASSSAPSISTSSPA
jgi:hypothetical protein